MRRLVGDHIYFEREDIPILEGVSFVVEQGRALLLRGENGAGKTTLLRLLAGFLPVLSGDIRFEGLSQEDDPFEHCHYIGHENALKAALSVKDNLTFWQRYYGARSGLSIEKALEAFGLEHILTTPVGYLSAGQKRKVALCRLLISKRSLWLLDEPTSALDAGSVKVFDKVMEKHLENGGLIVAATHLSLGIKSDVLHLGQRAQVQCGEPS